MLTGEHRRHVRLNIWKHWVTYTGTDLDMSPEW
jgi:hypothetical protein